MREQCTCVCVCVGVCVCFWFFPHFSHTSHHDHVQHCWKPRQATRSATQARKKVRERGGQKRQAMERGGGLGGYGSDTCSGLVGEWGVDGCLCFRSERERERERREGGEERVKGEGGGGGRERGLGREREKVTAVGEDNVMVHSRCLTLSHSSCVPLTVPHEQAPPHPATALGESDAQPIGGEVLRSVLGGVAATRAGWEPCRDMRTGHPSHGAKARACQKRGLGKTYWGPLGFLGVPCPLLWGPSGSVPRGD